MARRLLQEQGFDGAGVAEISREAGLTQGALYGQFGSKDALMAEATRQAFAEGAAAWAKLAEASPETIAAFVDEYLSDTHAKDVGGGCMIAACVSDIRRQDPAICKAFADGIRGLVETIQRALPGEDASAEAPRRALMLISALAGSMALARAVADTDPALAKEIIAAARAELAASVKGLRSPKRVASRSGCLSPAGPMPGKSR